tara:strand:+ start:77 stop:478 length:402 start_codon:yes stop_codon:yes gene_type:complete
MDIPIANRAFQPSLETDFNYENGFKSLKNFYYQNQKEFNIIEKVSPILTYGIIVIKILILYFGYREYRKREKGTVDAQTILEVEREKLLWQLKFGQMGLFDVFTGLLIAISTSLAMKFIFIVIKFFIKKNNET